MSRTGVLLLGFGGPDSLDAVAPFMRSLTGREPSPELVERVQGNYRAIGGSSPLAAIATDIAIGLGEQLAALGCDVPVRVGMRYWAPLIPDALRELSELGCDRVVTVSLSPFESKVASDAYREAIESALADLGQIEVVEAPLVSELPEFPAFLAESVRAALSGVDDGSALLVFTAHSLPESDLVENDPYVGGLRRIANAVAGDLGLPVGVEDGWSSADGAVRAFGSGEGSPAWALVYQSKGARPGVWLGPLLDDVIAAAPTEGMRQLVVCPIGFMTDHMETLFDLDVVAARNAAAQGVALLRVRVPNDDRNVIGALARAVAPLV